MNKPIIYWIRRDLRLDNNPALKFVIDSEQPVIPVFIKDEFVDNHGSAPKWRLGLGLEHLSAKYKKYGVDVIFRTGSAEKVLTDLINETQANQVVWARTYLPPVNNRDTHIKSLLKQKGSWLKVFLDIFCLSPGQCRLSPVSSLRFIRHFGKQRD